MAVLAFDFNGLLLFGVYVAVTVDILFRVTINAGHAFPVMDIGDEMIVIFAVKFPLLFTILCPGRTIAVTFNLTYKTHPGPSAPVVAMDALGLVYFYRDPVEHGPIFLFFGDGFVTSLISACIGI